MPSASLPVLVSALLLCLVAASRDSSLTYSLYKTIPTELHSDFKITYAPDYSFAVLYSPGTDFSPIFNPYGWTVYPNSDSYELFNPITITAFLNPATNSSYLIYTNDQFQVLLTEFTLADDHIEKLLYDGEGEDFCDRIVVSDDGSMWAMYCAVSGRLFVGNMEDTQQNATVVKYKEGCEVMDLAWKPNSLTLVVATKNQAENHPIFTYNAKNKQYAPLSINKQLVYRLAFTPEGTLFFLQDTSAVNFTRTLTKYSFTDSNLTNYTLNYQATDLQARGQFLSIRKNNVMWLVFTLESLHFTEGEEMHRLEGELRGEFMSHDGIFIANVQSKPSSKAQIYKLCNSDMLYYDAPHKTCSFCFTECRECLRSAGQCVSCSSSLYYLTPNRTCLPCSYKTPHCLTCKSTDDFQVQCTQCEQQYLSSNGSCRLCSDLFEGCKECRSNQQCSACFSGYVLNQSKCQPCQQTMLGCDSCLSLDQCSKCQKYYGLSPQGRCSLCSSAIDGCLLCSSASECLTCQLNFTLNPQTKQCESSQQNDDSVLVIILCVGTVVVVVAVVLVTLCVVMRMKQKSGRRAGFRQSVVGSSLSPTNEQSRVFEGGYLIPE